MTPAEHIQLAGALTLGIAFAHAFFPRGFGWREDVGKLQPLNRQIFFVHFGFIVLVLTLLGALSVGWSAELAAATGLGRPVLAGIALFWGARLAVQHAGYSPALWRGDRGRTAIHVGLTAVWGYLAFAYASPLKTPARYSIRPCAPLTVSPQSRSATRREAIMLRSTKSVPLVGTLNSRLPGSLKKPAFRVSAFEKL